MEASGHQRGEHEQLHTVDPVFPRTLKGRLFPHMSGRYREAVPVCAGGHQEQQPCGIQVPGYHVDLPLLQKGGRIAARS